MNFVGHIHVASRHLAERSDAISNDDGFLLGSALPDFAAMGRFRMTERPTDADLRAGVDLHHRTDDLFHAHPWFRRHSKAVSSALEEAGIGRGGARACGHVGVELLLDGLLLDRATGLRDLVESATASATDRSLALDVVVDVDRRTEWSAHLESVATWPLPRDYRSPDAVARRLRRILARRPRLAFDTDHVNVVAEVLGAHQPAIETETVELLDDLAAGLAA